MDRRVYFAAVGKFVGQEKSKQTVGLGNGDHFSDLDNYSRVDLCQRYLSKPPESKHNVQTDISIFHFNGTIFGNWSGPINRI